VFSYQCEFTVRKVATGEVKHVVRAHRERVTCIAFSPDGKRLASGSEDGKIRVWDTAFLRAGPPKK
jgi:WD40 repeat protein